MLRTLGQGLPPLGARHVAPAPPLEPWYLLHRLKSFAACLWLKFFFGLFVVCAFRFSVLGFILQSGRGEAILQVLWGDRRAKLPTARCLALNVGIISGLSKLARPLDGVGLGRVYLPRSLTNMRCFWGTGNAVSVLHTHTHTIARHI